MQLHSCVFLSIKNNIHQKVRDIKDSIFNIFFYFLLVSFHYDMEHTLKL